MQGTGRLVVAITGASGAIYALRFLQHATRHFERIYVMASEQALQVARTELGCNLSAGALIISELLGRSADNVVVVDRKDYFSPPASGSFRHDGMVVVPCSMGTAARIANGVSDDLVTRAADVCLKERRKLILVVRETPLNLVHLRNMTLLTEAGAIVMPASPGFYNNPKSIEELADFIVARILQQLGVDQEVSPQWQYTETD